MKKLIILLFAAFLVTGLSAQTSKRTSAFNYFKNGKMEKAKEYIDPCIEDAKTMNSSKTWYYRGNIYLQIALDSNYSYLDPNALEVAWESYNKCIELDKRDEYTNDIKNNMQIIAYNFFNDGVQFYNVKDYESAANSFMNTYKVSQEIGVTDTLALENVAYAYDLAEDYPNAEMTYKMLMELGKESPIIYSSLADMHFKMNDSVVAEEYIIAGREKFPDNYQLLIAETNLNLARGDNEKAVYNLTQALETDPTNVTIWFALGTNYESTGNMEEAEAAYNKCIEIDPEYSNAYYNLGAMYNNMAADIMEMANELPLDKVKEYDAEKAKSDALLEKALPYLEKSDELKPDDIDTLITLKLIYTNMNKLDKLKMVNEKIKALQE